MEPSADELVTLNTTEKVCLWIGIGQELITEVCGITGIGNAATEHPRTISGMLFADYQACVVAIQLPVEGAEEDAKTPMSLAQRSKVLQIHPICQLACGVTQTREAQAEAAKEYHNMQLELAKAGGKGTQVASQSQSDTPTAVHSSQLVRKTNLKVLDQHQDQELKTLTADELLAKFDAYHVAMGGSLSDANRERPLPEAEPTADQLTALAAALASGTCWADFSTFGPYGERSKREREFSALTMSAEGRLVKTKLFGPSTFNGWMSAWRVYRTAMIMCGAVKPTSLDAYEDVMRKSSLRFGQSAWGLLYQADHRARLEHLEHIKRDGELLFEQAKAAGPAAVAMCLFDPKMPWPYCFKTLARDTESWKEQFSEPALLIAAKVTREDAFIDGDALVSSAPFGLEVPALNASSASSAGKGASRRGQKRERNPPARDKTGRVKVHHISDGKFTHNRAGKPLCVDFNLGTCTAVVKAPSGVGTVCAKDKLSAHQCSACLQPHPANSAACQGNTTDRYNPGAIVRDGESRGKSKGKKGGQRFQ